MANYTARDLGIAFWFLAIAAYLVGAVALILRAEFPLVNPYMTYGATSVGLAGLAGLGWYAYELIEKPTKAWSEWMLAGFCAGILSLVFLGLLVV